MNGRVRRAATADWPLAAVSLRSESRSFKQRAGQWFFAHMPITHFLFDQIRVEINAGILRWKYRLLPWRWLQLRRLRRETGFRVNVACGPYVLSGLVNLDLFACSPDVVAWDCRWSLPFAPGSVAGIRAEQYVEHLEPREELPAFLKACLGALKPGGVLRMIVPDTERFLRAYCRDDLGGFRELAVPEPFPRDLPTRMDVVNHIFHQWHEHRWGYDFETLAHRVLAAGFARAEKMTYRQSLDPPLAEDRAEHAPYSLYVDAVKGN